MPRCLRLRGAPPMLVVLFRPGECPRVCLAVDSFADEIELLYWLRRYGAVEQISAAVAALLAETDLDAA